MGDKRNEFLESSCDQSAEDESFKDSVEDSCDIDSIFISEC